MMGPYRRGSTGCCCRGGPVVVDRQTRITELQQARVALQDELVRIEDRLDVLDDEGPETLPGY